MLKQNSPQVATLSSSTHEITLSSPASGHKWSDRQAAPQSGPKPLSESLSESMNELIKNKMATLTRTNKTKKDEIWSNLKSKEAEVVSESSVIKDYVEDRDVCCLNLTC